MGNGFFKILKYLFQCFLELIYCGEENCPVCGNYIDDYPKLCVDCSNKIIFLSDTSSIGNSKLKFECASVGYYSNVIAKLVMNLKYKSDFISGEILAKYMVYTAQERKLFYDLVCFVPCDRKTKKERGFNQAEYLARLIGKKLDIPIVSCIKKTKSSKDQIGLSYKERWNNIENCFIVHNKEKIKNKSIILIDDVITTGATAYFCSSCLINNGAEKVFILTAARSKL